MNGCPLALVACLLGVAVPVGTAQRRERPRSPEVHDDRTVTFRLDAPNAAEVKLSASFVEDDDAVMQRDADGMWTLTVGPLEPEIYGYKLVVDGLATVDPLGHDGRLGPWPETLFLIRDATPRAYELQGAPQGVVHIHRYTSTSLAMERRLHVYTPPGYTPETAYPVVYLLHGFGDDDAAWINMGRANIIADNLLADGKIPPMVIVMPHGHASTADMTVPDWIGDRAAFETDLLSDIMPLVSASYSVDTSVATTAIVGLSMGGGQALRGGLGHLDTFGWIGGFSSGAPRDTSDDPDGTTLDDAFADLLTRPTKPKLLWIGCGTDDFLYERNTEFLAWLERSEVPHTAHITGGGHSWSVWRKYLEEFLPLLFVD